MYKNEQKITVELVKEGNAKSALNMTNPISLSNSESDKLSLMISSILDEELPMLKNNSLLHNLVLYTLSEKMKTVQSVENVLSYIKDAKGKEVREVSFKNGEILIQCSI